MLNYRKIEAGDDEQLAEILLLIRQRAKAMERSLSGWRKLGKSGGLL